MVNIQFETPVNYSNTNYSVKDMIKLFEIKSCDFNNTISTVNSDSLCYEKNFKKLEKQKSNQQSIGTNLKNVPNTTESTVFFIDQDYYEIFNPVYPPINDIFGQKNKKNTKKSFKNNIKSNTLNNFNQNKYNNYMINNYFNCLWQIGDEFSEIHCFPLL
ncbi:uncharacterized protein cubi_02003 [Cryptosporidium ubiquitum]|uniref:Uncharacterized protein n=1 Tax=Cryptosporidium ubiquitum TaxID=857276 RepID=A0A1J4MMJ9_9CRYT|nr:uncharacterized protein cubi_02003 [Cryptosporidium ubiquitum]OII75482.1 hypothetical protein cubi_02003 [Cryptosporidium ubiquitum]